MRTTRLVSAFGGITAALISVAACGGGEQAASTTTAAAAPTTTTATTTTAAMGDGVTTTGDVFGAGCASLPKDTEGSLDGMVDDPVATAAGNNPLLTKLVAAVKAAGLVDTLNKTDAKYTVFAPYDPAFEALGQDALNAVLADKAKLTSILTFHVVPQRMDKDGIVSAASLPTVQGGALKVEGAGDDITVNGAKVLCGNIPTANATVFVIDKVMMPAS
ncbi:fasciclin domain-containing protein [Actinokineospora iranica]|uniref:Uncaracterized surface protein containing fasciclin (FAS1) repeats n=1 Tax=Actinokineospora iranica TaxID=1271860 RepID=A0A1G6KRR7_9PSEU|nr:fasciclin domain-containing protein [Actinokineospora iranica]SDC33750.1 Uncaracterized surface protein containing fasciclin (FAS1) repeats [Actinokineospora iranica]